MNIELQAENVVAFIYQCWVASHLIRHGWMSAYTLLLGAAGIFVLTGFLWGILHIMDLSLPYFAGMELLFVFDTIKTLVSSETNITLLGFKLPDMKFPIFNEGNNNKKCKKG